MLQMNPYSCIRNTYWTSYILFPKFSHLGPLCNTPPTQFYPTMFIIRYRSTTNTPLQERSVLHVHPSGPWSARPLEARGPDNTPLNGYWGKMCSNKVSLHSSVIQDVICETGVLTITPVVSGKVRIRIAINIKVGISSIIFTALKWIHRIYNEYDFFVLPDSIPLDESI